MTTSASVTEIQAALIKARAEIENLNPSAKGYSYTYVPLEKVIDHLKDILPKHGLGYVQLPSGGAGDTIGLSTRIIHSSGEWIEDTATFKLTDMKGVNVSQASGSAITYFRRYALCAAFGITGDEDCDADPTRGKGNDKEPNKNAETAKREDEKEKAKAEYFKLINAVNEVGEKIYDDAWISKWNAMLREKGLRATIAELKKDQGIA